MQSGEDGEQRDRPTRESLHDISVAIVGSGGAGAITTGQLLIHAARANGLFGLARRSYGPQIRGGECAALLRLADSPRLCSDDEVHLLAALDWRNAERFSDEVPLAGEALILQDEAAGRVPDGFLERDPRVVELELSGLAREVRGGRANAVLLGALSRILAWPLESALDVIGRDLGWTGTETVEASLECAKLGWRAAGGVESPVAPPRSRTEIVGKRWSLTGNEACGLGALRAGVRFVAGYPITPATDLLEWLSPRIERLGGCLVQAEDELAAINMVLGASFGGVPSLTATSGPGLSLMAETVGLAVASETPAVVIDVQRCGPSTGIPTKAEQSDLGLALDGLHGDAPHLVLAPLDVIDCVATTEWAVGLSEALQSPAIVLTDQGLGQTRAVVDAPPTDPRATTARRLTAGGGPYRRYAITPTGVSPTASPGEPGHVFTADGLEHDETGKPSSRASDHAAQLEKRASKLRDHDFGIRWCRSSGTGPLVILGWGSSAGAIEEAADRLRAEDASIRTIAIRLLYPPPEGLQEALDHAERLLVVEQSSGRQFHRYLRAHYELPTSTRVLARPGPLPIRPGELVAEAETLLDGERLQ